MKNYKSWSLVKRRLEYEFLCEALQSRIGYFLTSYHKVRNCYSRASVRLDGKDIIHFNWGKGFKQEFDISEYMKTNEISYKTYLTHNNPLQEKWNKDCTYSDSDFLNAVLEYFNMSISDALVSENYIIKMLAILDKRVGKRTLSKLNDSNYLNQLPEWLSYFYLLRFEAEGFILSLNN